MPPGSIFIISENYILEISTPKKARKGKMIIYILQILFFIAAKCDFLLNNFSRTVNEYRKFHTIFSAFCSTNLLQFYAW